MKDKKYIKEVVGYKILIQSQEKYRWEEQLFLNKPLTPEIVGNLLGRAEVVFRDKLCEVCKKPILDGSEHKFDPNTPDWNSARGKIIHEKCYLKLLENKK